MYHSRIRVSNGIVTIGVDANTGGLLELVCERDGDNLIKNHNPAVHQPFSLAAAGGDGPAEIRPAPASAASREPACRPVISVEDGADGSKTLKVRYGKLSRGGEPVDIGAEYEVFLPAGGCETRWTLRLDNRAGGEIVRVLFPSVQGVYIGDTWKDDAIVYPYNAGERIENPVETYAAEPSVIYWKWQEYLYQYLASGSLARREESGAYVREALYSGPLSMLWMDYYDQNCGLYVACHDNGARVAALRAETFGPSRPGMGLSVVHHPYLQSGTWQSPACAVALHEGDWHWGADRYREATARGGGEDRRAAPEWFKKSPGLVAHYDFKYQGGGIVHRFSDIPGLYERAGEIGLNHLLFSGWHTDGFDNGFPKYRPDADLGTEEELGRAVRAVRERGGHVSYYVNSRLSNTKYGELAEEREALGAMRRGGGLYEEKYGDKGLAFAGMCPNASGWRRRIVDALRRLVETAGADSIYLDQLAMAPALFCANGAHGHRPDGWNDGYRRMIAETFEACGGIALLYEGVSDIHGAGVAGQLISTFFHHHVGAFPEMYKYTFPDQILVDMLYPRRGQAMRPVHVVQRAEEIMDRAFVTGAYYWVYDLEEDNTFDGDAELKALLIQMVALRRKWLESFGHGVFRDGEGISAVSPGLLAKRFRLPDGELVAVANPRRDGDAYVGLALPASARARCALYGAEAPGAPREVELKRTKTGLTIPVGNHRLAILHLR